MTSLQSKQGEEFEDSQQGMAELHGNQLIKCSEFGSVVECGLEADLCFALDQKTETVAVDVYDFDVRIFLQVLSEFGDEYVH